MASTLCPGVSYLATAGSKKEAIREQVQMSATRYYQLLNRLLDTEPTLAADPVLVKRLLRLCGQRHGRPD